MLAGPWPPCSIGGCPKLLIGAGVVSMKVEPRAEMLGAVDGEGISVGGVASSGVVADGGAGATGGLGASSTG